MLNIRTFILLFNFCATGILPITAQINPNPEIEKTNIDKFVTIPYTDPQKGTVTINEDPRIKILLNLKSKMEKEGDFSDRYKIQLYYGNLNQANEIMTTSKNVFKDWEATIKWETPNYKVWLGNFRTRLDADKALIKVHEEFPNAFIFKPE